MIDDPTTVTLRTSHSQAEQQSSDYTATQRNQVACNFQSGSDPKPQSEVEQTPRIFHFVFGLRPQTEPFHLVYYICLKSCIEINNPDAVYFHYDKEPWGPWWDKIKTLLVLNQISPDRHVQGFRYKNAEFEGLRYAHLSDITRMEVLYEYGGLYADIDTLFISPLPERLFREPFVMGEELAEHTADGRPKSPGSLCNAWMMGKPNAEFLKLWMDRFAESFDGSWNNHSTLLPYRLSQERPDLIHVEPRRSFFHLSYTTADLTRLFFEDYEDLDGVYSIHLWNHLWQDNVWWSREFTRPKFLRGDAITPAFILHSKSTYARLSRRYLPDDIAVSKASFARERRLFSAKAACIYYPKKLLQRFNIKH